VPAPNKVYVMSDIKELARLLWEARRDGQVIDPCGVQEPESIEQAYAVQDELVRLSGQPSAAIKVGSTSAEARSLLGTTEPGSCPVLARYCFETPATIRLVADNMPALEGEFAFRLRHQLAPREAAYGDAEVYDAIEAVAGAIEVVGSRLRGGLAGRGRYFATADSGVNIALIVGEWQHNWRDFDLKAQPVTMLVNSEKKGAGTGARALGDPLAVMVWLANHYSHRGQGLRAGEVVSTGTCTGLDSVYGGDHVIADFASLGQVEVNFT
jgi:2-keto-4-pentenoate hydratase